MTANNLLRELEKDKVIVTLLMFGIPIFIATKIPVWNIDFIMVEIFGIFTCAMCWKIYVWNNIPTYKIQKESEK